MGYEIRMQSDIVALLNLFAAACADKVSNRQVRELAASSSAWIRGHSVFDELRDRNLAAISAGDRMKAAQYCFEEACVKSLYNEVVWDGAGRKPNGEEAVANARRCEPPSPLAATGVGSV